MYKIAKKFGPYAASHRLEGLPAGHKCRRNHGHNYEVELILACYQLNPYGMVLDYGKLKPFGDICTEIMDHQDLNETLGDVPTAEAIAFQLYKRAKNLFGDLVHAVRVAETPGQTWAEYSDSHETP